MPVLKAVALTGALFGAPFAQSPLRAGGKEMSNRVLLSYWSFNNASPFEGPPATYGAFQEKPAVFGEGYDPALRRIASRNDVGAIFAGPEIYVDVKGLNGDNGGRVQSNWGAYKELGANRLPRVEPGSSLGLSGRRNDGSFITFALASKGHKAGEFSFTCSRSAPANVAEKVNVTYEFSGDGEHFEQIGSPHELSDNIEVITVDLSEIEAAQDAGHFFVRLVFKGITAQIENIRVDNVKLTGEVK